jgi:hypothetical protein
MTVITIIFDVTHKSGAFVQLMKHRQIIPTLQVFFTAWQNTAKILPQYAEHTELAGSLRRRLGNDWQYEADHSG